MEERLKWWERVDVKGKSNRNRAHRCFHLENGGQPLLIPRVISFKSRRSFTNDRKHERVQASMETS